MKHLSIRLSLLALTFCIAGSAFTPKARIHATPHSAKPSAKMAQMFFWFVEPADYLDYYCSMGDEIAAMEVGGGMVDNDPSGGYLLVSGYAFVTLPHNQNPQTSLYVHY